MKKTSTLGIIAIAALLVALVLTLIFGAALWDVGGNARCKASAAGSSCRWRSSPSSATSSSTSCWCRWSIGA